MKKPILILILFLSAGITITSCEKANSINPANTTSTTSSRVSNNHWFRYDETRCNNPWHFDWLMKPTDEQLAGAVKGYLNGLQINIMDIRASRDEKIASSSCGDCTCLNGVQYYARVISTDDMKKLIALNFYEVPATEVPASTTDTK